MEVDWKRYVFLIIDFEIEISNKIEFNSTVVTSRKTYKEIEKILYHSSDCRLIWCHMVQYLAYIYVGFDNSFLIWNYILVSIQKRICVFAIVNCMVVQTRIGLFDHEEIKKNKLQGKNMIVQFVVFGFGTLQNRKFKLDFQGEITEFFYCLRHVVCKNKNKENDSVCEYLPHFLM